MGLGFLFKSSSKCRAGEGRSFESVSAEIGVIGVYFPYAIFAYYAWTYVLLLCI
jgi:hypothetical protein